MSVGTGPPRTTGIVATERIVAARPRRAATGSVLPRVTGIGLIAPAVALYGVFVGYPLIRSLYLSLTSWPGYGNAKFIGLSNFSSLLSDPVFISAATNTLEYVGITTVLLTVLPLSVAVLLTYKWRFSRLYRTAIFVPAILSLTVTGLLWSIVLQPQFGLVNQIFRDVGVAALAQPWLAQSSTVLGAIILVSVWQSLGFFMLIFYAALQTIDPALYESARLDGATRWQEVTRVTVPLVKGATGIVVLLNVINGFKVFDVIFVMTQGGPAHASESLSTYLYALAFGTQNGGQPAFGYAAAIGLVVFLGGALATALWYIWSRRAGRERRAST